MRGVRRFHGVVNKRRRNGRMDSLVGNSRYHGEYCPQHYHQCGRGVPVHLFVWGECDCLWAGGRFLRFINGGSTGSNGGISFVPIWLTKIKGSEKAGEVLMDTYD